MLTPEQKEIIRALYEDGWAVEEIADVHNLDECEVLDYVDYLEQNI